MKKRTKGIIIFLICLVLVVLVATMLSDNGAGEISYTSLVEDIKAGKVANIQITGDYVLKVRYNDSKIAEKNFPNKYDAFCYIPDRNVQQVYDMIEDCQGNTGWTSPRFRTTIPRAARFFTAYFCPYCRSCFSVS